MTEPTKADLEMRIRILEKERDELIVSLSVARCDVLALEAELTGLRAANEALRRLSISTDQLPEPRP